MFTLKLQVSDGNIPCGFSILYVMTSVHWRPSSGEDESEDFWGVKMKKDPCKAVDSRQIEESIFFIRRFPSDFMFQMTADELETLRSQNVTLKKGGRAQHPKYAPCAFTQEGVAEGSREKARYWIREGLRESSGSQIVILKVAVNDPYLRSAQPEP